LTIKDGVERGRLRVGKLQACNHVDDNMSTTLPVLFLDDAVVLPGMVLPIELTSQAQASIDAARAARGGGRSTDLRDTARESSRDPLRLLLVPRIEGRTGVLGTVAEVTQIGRLPSGEPAAVLRAVSRARIGTGVSGPGAALWVEAEILDTPAPTASTRELAAEYKHVLTSILQQRQAYQVIDAVQRMIDPSELADAAGYASWIETADKLRLLETIDVAERLEFLLERAKAYLAEMEVSEKIASDVREGMEKSQREYLLRQQLAAIRKELGELSGDSGADGATDYRSRIEAADLPEAVRTAALREADRLERTPEQSPEGGWIRTWLDTVLELPWTTKTADTTDIVAARAILDADHTGLDDVKERIVEYLAVRARRAERGLEVVGGRGSGAVLALVGPPGVGKTSLGESVARALGRKFVRVALGGVRDEAEIRGHRRTYVGALPGRIVRAIKEAGTMNPVVLLDEVDKVGSDYRGDPAAALLEVLDPAQNHTFRDHYLELDLDLSDVVFLATANVAETIPGPLLDRMELVRLDGYTEEEKVAIARDHLLPRQIERAGLTADEVVLTEEALGAVAGEHTHEAGVRQLERAIAKILRKVAAQLAAGTAQVPVTVGAEELRTYLGRPRFTPESAERTAVPGVATGLAVTGAGGDVLFVEVATMDGEPGLTLTGQLGDVMKESAQIALSYLRANGDRLGVPTFALGHERVHVHFPAGAVPKDGPSAGVTMTTALASLLTGRLVKADVGMTGEVSLTGRVLPIGGVKQKLLAAHRAGLTEVILPERNGPDLDDVPEEVREQLTVHLVADVAQVLELALEAAEAAAPAEPTSAAA
jgi:ATP-dependent Lon protease